MFFTELESSQKIITSTSLTACFIISVNIPGYEFQLNVNAFISSHSAIVLTGKAGGGVSLLLNDSKYLSIINFSLGRNPLGKWVCANKPIFIT